MGLEFPLRVGVSLGLRLVAAIVKDVRFHLAFAVANVVYQVSYIVRRYDVLTG